MRKAKCACGDVSLELDGEPDAIVACHCLECQRRTGAPFGVGVYYPLGAVRMHGETRVFTRGTDSGRVLTNYFCVRCGSTAYWFTDKHPDRVGVAFGMIEGDPLPAPERSVWEQSRHTWVSLDGASERYLQGRQSAPAGTT
jgi:hypothetical protein